MKKNIEEINSSILNLSSLIENKFKIIENSFEDKFKKLDNDISFIKKKLDEFNINASQDNLNFENIEDKVDFLNKKVQHIDMSIISYINENCTIDKEDVNNIIHKKVTINNIICDILYNLNQDTNKKFIFTFKFQKYIIYLWNEDKQTWDKSTPSYLKEIFETIQKKIIFVYNEIVKEYMNNPNHNFDFIESGELIYVDFDKKMLETKKYLCQLFK